MSINNFIEGGINNTIPQNLETWSTYPATSNVDMNYKDLVDTDDINSNTITSTTGTITTAGITTGNISTANISTRLRVNGADNVDTALVKVSSTGTTNTDYLKIYSNIPSVTPDNLLLFRGEPDSGSLKGVLYLGDAFQNQSDANYRIKLDTTANSFINTGNNSYLGLGTTSPQCKLHLNRTDSVSTNFRMSNSQNTDGTDLVCNSSGGFDMANRLSGSNSYIRFLTNGSTERMRILNSGNIGVNTTNPSSTLDVNGIIKGASYQSNGNFSFLSNNLTLEPPAGTGNRNFILCQASSSGSGIADRLFRYRNGGGGSRDGWAGTVYSYFDNPNYMVTANSGNLTTRVFTSLTDLNNPANLGTELTRLTSTGDFTVAGDINVGSKLSYDTNSNYTVLSGASSTITRTLADYTPDMTEMFYWNPATGSTHTLTYKISAEMMAKGGSLTIMLVEDHFTSGDNIDLNIISYKEAGGANYNGIWRLGTTPLALTDTFTTTADVNFQIIKIYFAPNSPNGDPSCMIRTVVSTN